MDVENKKFLSIPLTGLILEGDRRFSMSVKAIRDVFIAPGRHYGVGEARGTQHMISFSYSNDHYSPVRAVRHPHRGTYYFPKQWIITLFARGFAFNVRQFILERKIIINLCICKQQFSPMGSLKNNFQFTAPLRKNLGTRSKGVVSQGADLGKLNAKLLHLLVRDLLAFDILPFQQARSHSQPRLGGGSTNVVEHGLKAA